MAIRAKDIYDGRKKSRFHLGITITVILAVVVALILIFYWLRGYAVYDEDGNATIVMPWSQKASTESPAVSPAESPVLSPSETPPASPPENTADSSTESQTDNPTGSTSDSSETSLPDAPVGG